MIRPRQLELLVSDSLYLRIKPLQGIVLPIVLSLNHRLGVLLSKPDIPKLLHTLLLEFDERGIPRLRADIKLLLGNAIRHVRILLGQIFQNELINRTIPTKRPHERVFRLPHCVPSSSVSASTVQSELPLLNTLQHGTQLSLPSLQFQLSPLLSRS